MLYVHQILVATDTLETGTELQISPFFLIDSLMISRLDLALNKRVPTFRGVRTSWEHSEILTSNNHFELIKWRSWPEVSPVDLIRILQNMMINKVNDSLHYWIIGNVFPEQCVLCVSHRQIKQECTWSRWRIWIV